MPRSDEPSEVCGRLVEGEEGAGQERVIVGEAPHAGGPIAPRAEHPAVLVPEVLPHEVRAADRGVHVGRLVEDPTGLGEGTDRERVPGGQDLVVEGGTHARLASFEQPLAGLFEGVPRRGPQHVRSVPVPCRGRTERRRRVLADERYELLPGPDRELPLDAFAVGILG